MSQNNTPCKNVHAHWNNERFTFLEFYNQEVTGSQWCPHLSRTSIDTSRDFACFFCGANQLDVIGQSSIKSLVYCFFAGRNRNSFCRSIQCDVLPLVTNISIICVFIVIVIFNSPLSPVSGTSHRTCDRSTEGLRL